MFEKDISTAMLQLNRSFSSNLLLLDLEKTYFLQFSNKNTKTTDLYTNPENSQVTNVHSIQCSGLVIENNVLWHCHFDQMISKPNKASCVTRSLELLLSPETLKMVYFSIAHSVIL